jgi:CrcB protein
VITATAWLAVAVGGAVGAPLRFLVDRAVTNRVAGVEPPREFPWGLMVVNGVGSALAGVVLATTTGDLRVLLLVGLCGSLTTFSGFAWEADRLWSTARTAFWAAVLVMPTACVALFMLTWQISRLIVG